MYTYESCFKLSGLIYMLFNGFDMVPTFEKEKKKKNNVQPR